ncbi:MAG: hypothetical protein GY906_40405, partial [bacterium]|nr:hypothetical protein [bacterium]
MRRVVGVVCAVVVAVLVTSSLSVVEAQQRFPRPEFDSDYQLPETTAPLATSQIVEFTDIIVLATALAFATYFA